MEDPAYRRISRMRIRFRAARVYALRAEIATKVSECRSRRTRDNDRKRRVNVQTEILARKASVAD